MLNLLIFFLALIPTFEEGRVSPLKGEIEKAHCVPTKEGWITPTNLPQNNISLYSDETYAKIKALDPHAFEEGYRSLVGKTYTKSFRKNLTYPSLNRLKCEALFMKAPLIPFLFLLYLTATLFRRRSFLLIAFTAHTLLLLGRVYILGRPPVSNMMETILYVPWIATMTALFCGKRKTTLFAGSLSATALLLFLPPHQSFETVQAVLDSSYWLTIHVLLIVGSYGILIYAGVLAHIYLITKRYFTPLLKSLYIGTALLIVGTILGGVWAAQSWGRFWDWDPKEAWAFISAGIYLAFIHGYKFRKIKEKGLAIGAIIGLLAISFTWYGVNYILGTGLHSYGFGGGGESLYYSYLLLEVSAIIFFTKKDHLQKKGKKDTPSSSSEL
ncbi:MAG: Cytochrome c biogenesis protein CcsA [Chlamydiales bacterium]|nr:Cytochrome c biogenesis protein CcsA [Chlamydiales bacterium]MCH9620523.1 Cytochrome c biogenesis protein CcsA [Chlamydiales bacterium]MCH9623026.1 Cytochrome c biogenesis protein CcsA [Chlamydiales bacterium]